MKTDNIISKNGVGYLISEFEYINTRWKDALYNIDACKDKMSDFLRVVIKKIELDMPKDLAVTVDVYSYIRNKTGIGILRLKSFINKESEDIPTEQEVEIMKWLILNDIKDFPENKRVKRLTPTIYKREY